VLLGCIIKKKHLSVFTFLKIVVIQSAVYVCLFFNLIFLVKKRDN